jgi:hypothetical protein
MDLRNVRRLLVGREVEEFSYGIEVFIGIGENWR